MIKIDNQVVDPQREIKDKIVVSALGLTAQESTSALNKFLLEWYMASHPEIRLRTMSKWSMNRKHRQSTKLAY